jgi:hypothetical protein
MKVVQHNRRPRYFRHHLVYQALPRPVGLVGKAHGLDNRSPRTASRITLRFENEIGNARPARCGIAVGGIVLDNAEMRLFGLEPDPLVREKSCLKAEQLTERQALEMAVDQHQVTRAQSRMCIGG